MPINFTQFGAAQAGQLAGNAVQASGGGIIGLAGQWGNYYVTCGLIDWASLSQLYVNRLIDVQQWEAGRRFNGMEGDNHNPSTYQLLEIDPDEGLSFRQEAVNANMHFNDRAIQWLKSWPTVDELGVMINRKMIPESTAVEIGAIQFGGERSLAWQMLQLRYQIPGPSDLIAFAVRDCFSPQIVQTFQYNKELPIDILPFMEMQGLHGQLAMQMPTGSTTTIGPDNRTKPQWFDLYWWSHWQLPSVGQGYEMLHRLYLTSSHGPAPGVTQANEFNQGHMDILLKAQDFPPFWRQRLTDISYMPLTRVDVRRMFDLRVVNENEVYHAYRAIGYDDTNANRLVDFAKVKRAQTELGPVTKATINELREQYWYGIIDSSELTNELKALDIQYYVIVATIQLWDMQKQKQTIKENLKYIKEAFLIGTLSMFNTVTALNNLGISSTERTRLTDLWDKIKFAKRKFVSASQNLKMFEDGMLSENNLRIRLMNLNFDSAEINQMVNYSKAKIIVKNNKALAKAISEVQKAQKEAIAALIKPYTDKLMIKWYKNGTLTLLDVYRILKLRGWIKGAILDWINSELGDSIDPADQTKLDNEDTTDTQDQLTGV